MARILVTGSAQGIGAEVARQLIAQGHDVVVHGRDRQRADAALAEAPGAADAVVGALDSLSGVRGLAEQSRAAGRFDVVIHNAAVSPHRDSPSFSPEGIEISAQVNVVAPYLLTALLPVPKRVVYVGSDASDQGEFHLDDFGFAERPWDRWAAYNDSKLYLAMLALEVANRYPDTVSTVVHPGWVQTVMGGAGAQIPVAEGADSIVWLATSNDQAATASGRFIDRRHERNLNPLALDDAKRRELIDHLATVTGVRLGDGG